VAYYLQYADAFKRRFRSLAGLSRNARIRLYATILIGLRELPEEVRLDPVKRHPAGKPQFMFDVVLMDAGRLRHFAVSVDDSAANQGVLQVLDMIELTDP
jgi:hypothetical protein